VLHGALKRDDSANDTLYFKFRVVPDSDKDTEDYLAAFELFDGKAERLGVGNALKAWAYSVFFDAGKGKETDETLPYIDLRTQTPEPESSTAPYQYPRHGVPVTIVFKVQYVPGEDDLVTIWLNPDLGPGANEASQPDNLTTKLSANASFDEVHLRHLGRGGGWSFGDLAIATSFIDFVDSTSARPLDVSSAMFAGPKSLDLQAFQKEQGLPQTPIRALCQTSDRYLWIGSEGGVTRFDGTRFVSFGVQEGLRTGAINAMLEDPDGRLWLGCEHGISFWQGGAISAATLPEHFFGARTVALCRDGGGRLWAGTDRGLLLFEHNTFTVATSACGLGSRRIRSLSRIHDGVLCVTADEAGVFRFDTNGFIRIGGIDGNSVLRMPRQIVEDRDRNLWLLAGEDSLFRLENTAWQPVALAQNKTKLSIATITPDLTHGVWLGLVSGGLLRINENGVVEDYTPRGFAGTTVRCMLPDNEGNMWIGTDSALNRIRPKVLFALGQSSGLGLGAVGAMTEVSPGVVWVAKPRDGTYRWDGRTFSRLSLSHLSSRGADPTALITTSNGFCWAATTNGLLLYKDPIAAADEVRVVPSSPRTIISLAEGHASDLWAGTEEGGLWRLKDGQWQLDPRLAQTRPIAALSLDSHGVWAGTKGNGLFYLDDRGGMRRFEDPGIYTINVLYVDAQDSVWIGTEDHGLSRLHDGKLQNYFGRTMLPKTICEIMDDSNRRLWLGCDSGIVSVEKSALEQFFGQRAPPVHAHILNQVDGMLSERCCGGFTPAGLRANRGLLWFPTIEGVAVINPQAEPTGTTPPSPILEEITVDGVPARPTLVVSPAASALANANAGRDVQGFQIGPGRHRVEFRYAQIKFDHPELTRFRYRLDGLDTDWIEAGARRTAFYSYLPAGNYAFRVAASGRDGAWVENVFAVPVFVGRYFWQSGWFIAISALALVVSIAGTVRVLETAKLHRRLERAERESALERERTRIAQDLHDQMGAKLCRISFLSEHARRAEIGSKDLKEQITSISDTSRDVLRSLDEIVWAVNPQKDTLEHLASYIGQYAHDYFQSTGVDCDLDIPTELPAYPVSSHVRHHLFLATHEALTNILKHSAATRAKLSMSTANDAFEISVSDNGKGFDTSSSSNSSGNGLINIFRRVEEIGGRYSVESQPGKGTAIRIGIPLTAFNNGGSKKGL
jgi:signal transduction histidine kinase/ligand-binding sensor domain-containing protein